MAVQLMLRSFAQRPPGMIARDLPVSADAHGVRPFKLARQVVTATGSDRDLRWMEDQLGATLGPEDTGDDADYGLGSPF